MPQSNRSISDFDLRSDMNNYYRHSIVTYLQPITGGGINRLAAWVSEFDGNNDELTATIKVLEPQRKDYSSTIRVPVESLDLNLPQLGLVKVSNNWWMTARSPQRRMRKGFNDECILLLDLEGGPYVSYNEPVNPVCKDIVKQLWYGNDERISPNVVVWGKGVYYMTDKVATVDDSGAVVLIPNKEKLGELTCKILANNWDTVVSKTSVRILPSSVQTPLA